MNCNGDEPLHGRTALVTGAAVRVGRAIALELAGAGARVAVHYRSSAVAAERTAAECGRGAKAFRADLRSLDEIDALVSDVKERFGTPSILVNNAAVFGRTPFETTTEEEWDRFMEVNARGPFFLTRAWAATATEGLVVNIADSAGVTILPGYLAYSASKAALVALTRGLAKVLAPSIRVNAVLPGPVLLAEGEEDRKTVEETIRRTVLGRIGTPRDVARAVRYLAVEGDYITGALLPVDGGRLLGG